MRVPVTLRRPGEFVKNAHEAVKKPAQTRKRPSPRTSVGDPSPAGRPRAPATAPRQSPITVDSGAVPAVTLGAAVFAAGPSGSRQRRSRDRAARQSTAAGPRPERRPINHAVGQPSGLAVEAPEPEPGAALRAGAGARGAGRGPVEAAAPAPAEAIQGRSTRRRGGALREGRPGAVAASLLRTCGPRPLARAPARPTFGAPSQEHRGSSTTHEQADWD